MKSSVFGIEAAGRDRQVGDFDPQQAMVRRGGTGSVKRAETAAGYFDARRDPESVDRSTCTVPVVSRG